MKFEIKCATFVRLATICGYFEPTTPKELKDQINTIRLEKVNGRTYAIATNQKIAAIELLPQIETPENGVIHLVLDPALIAQCKNEIFFDSSLIITVIPEIATAMAQTSTGWNFVGNPCHWFSETVMDNWRSWVGKPVSQSSYIMAWDLSRVQTLFESSPSGKIYFPRYIDASKPVTLRDKNSDNWVGIFIPGLVNGEHQKQEAELPEWWPA